MSASSIQTVREEIVNAITHGLGAALSIAALPIMIVTACNTGGAARIVSASIFGSSLFLLYLISTLYHSLPQGRAKAVFQRLDHICIYLLIAGTYTPFTLCVLQGGLGWSLFGIVWGMAAAGIIFKAIFGPRYDAVSAVCYVAMGWLVLLAIKTIFISLTPPALGLLIAGGAFYTLGVPFYLKDTKIHWFHSIWHCFVLAGSICHFLAVTIYVL